ncbi:hypothetical protein [Caballeronia sp. LZ035]|uniref:hypothetical protein n=1 Tax=Caballeronia sp. LZ035 TaxID=3038568 RepID=UPI0028672BB3|nr:hypothetical protein [Caballeronia sp. LZ035]MDR5760761.1 hypothetical protein [Caballeronia sp. LZ035]
MSASERNVSTLAGLLEAVSNAEVHHIAVTADIADMPGFRLLPGQTLSGASGRVKLHFAKGEDGVQLTTDNCIARIELNADADRRAIHNDTSVTRLGRIDLHDLRTRGVVQLLARDNVRSGHIAAENIDIVAADARAHGTRHRGYGVEVIPGVFTVWNQHDDHFVTITADLTAVSAGRGGAPVNGSGIFVGGAGDTGGQLIVGRMETGAIHSDGGIEHGTADRIAGGVFVSSGACVEIVHNRGPVTTYGANDMVLDNWGTVGSWIAEEKLTSYGPSATGFVNFGTLGMLRTHATIETFGFGARGFSDYDGTVQLADIDRIVTHADGAVGIQVSRPLGLLTVRRGIETHGAAGESMVKGVVVTLDATALCIRNGAAVRKITVDGGLLTHGRGATPLRLHGKVEDLRISDGAGALGGGFAAA